MLGRIIVLGLLYCAACYGHSIIGGVRNVTVKVVALNQSNLKLNISWLPPETRRKQTSYSVIVSSVASSNPSCPDGSIYYVGQDAEQGSVLLPENRFPFEVDEAELDVEPGCSYRIQVQANPRSTGENNTRAVVYSVPECVGTRCNCERALEALPVPVVSIVGDSSVASVNGSVLVTWKVEANSSLVNSYKVSVGMPHITSSSGLTVYNKTQIYAGSGNSIAWKLPADKPKKGTKVFVAAGDAYGCWGKEGSSLALARGPRLLHSRDHNHHVDQNRFTLIFLAGFTLVCLTLGGALSYIKYFSNYPTYKLLHLGKTTSREIAPVLNTLKIEALLKNHNVLYFEENLHQGAKGSKKDPLEVAPSRVRVSRELGRGQFGRVYLADLLEATGRRRVAVKTSLMTTPSCSESRRQLLEEIGMIKIAGAHPHLVGLVGYCTLENSPVCLLLEYMEGGDLLAYLHRKRRKGPKEEEEDKSEEVGKADREGTNYCSRRPYLAAAEEDAAVDDDDAETTRFALEIARGMAHLEAKGIVHRDLAARNVLMNDNLVLKISDFGLSRDGGSYTMGGSPGVRRLPIRWMPAETIAQRAFTSKSDVWSYGVVLWEIATLGEFPYARYTNDEDLLRHLLEEDGRPELFPGLPRFDSLGDLMSLCWAKEPSARPNFGQVLAWLESKLYPGGTHINNPAYQGIGEIKSLN